MLTEQPPLPLFAYGTLMSDQPAFPRLAHAVDRHVPAVLDNIVLHAIGWYPMAIPGAGQVLGEVIWLKPALFEEVLAALDAYEGDEYTRVRCIATLAGGPAVDQDDDHEDEQVECWLYLGDPAIAAAYPLVKGGNWRAHQLAASDGDARNA